MSSDHDIRESARHGQQPTPGRIVLYQLSEHDVEQVIRRRTDSRSIASRMDDGTWPRGAQAHLGNTPRQGELAPLLVIRVFLAGAEADPDPGPVAVNGQVFLDGTDVLWVSSRLEGTAPGTWAWPTRG
jgi:hypothetical protein